MTLHNASLNQSSDTICSESSYLTDEDIQRTLHDVHFLVVKTLNPSPFFPFSFFTLLTCWVLVSDHKSYTVLPPKAGDTQGFKTSEPFDRQEWGHQSS
jgi:hypothetical protein